MTYLTVDRFKALQAACLHGVAAVHSHDSIPKGCLLGSKRKHALMYFAPRLN